MSASIELKPVLQDAVAAFELREGVKINTTYGPWHRLVLDMRNRKSNTAIEQAKQGNDNWVFPDICFASDSWFLDEVREWFDTGQIVSKNDLVLVVAKGNPHGIQGLADLTRAGLRVGRAVDRRAIGLETTALGKLTNDCLTKLELAGKIKSRPADGEDPGNYLLTQMSFDDLDAVIVFRSNALSLPLDVNFRPNAKKVFDIVELPGGYHACQTFAIAKDSPRRDLARRFLEFITSPTQADHFRALGFGSP